jgi:hypothetical protein
VLLDFGQRYDAANNGQLTYFARAAGDVLHASKATGSRVLTELVELGFLRVTRDSSFMLKTKEARTWALTAEPVDGRSPTKDGIRPVDDDRPMNQPLRLPLCPSVSLVWISVV